MPRRVDVGEVRGRSRARYETAMRPNADEGLRVLRGLGRRRDDDQV
jgi:hypothetical protein